MTNEPAILTLAQVCELTQLSDTTIRRAIRDGRLVACRPGGRDLRITREQLQQWLASTSTSTSNT